jgi:hypothetical protein
MTRRQRRAARQRRIARRDKLQGIVLALLGLNILVWGFIALQAL